MSPLLLLAAAPDAPLTLSVGGGSAAVKLFLLMTALSFATALLVSITSFTRIVVVLSFARQALGTPQLPPNQVILALALAMSGFVMAPTAIKVNEVALTPYFDEKLGATEAIDAASSPIREFLLRQTRPDDLRMFYEVSDLPRPKRADAVPLTVAIPAFMVSELTTAFRMGLSIFVPMLVIDLLVSTILMALGMMMVPPNLISLPLKVGVFLLADGWHLLVGSLIKSF